MYETEIWLIPNNGDDISESNLKMSDFLSSEDLCNEWLRNRK